MATNTDPMAAMRAAFERELAATNERLDTIDRGRSSGSIRHEAISGLAAWIPVSDDELITFTTPPTTTRWIPETDLHRVQYSAFCQQWIAVAMAAIVGRE